MSGRGDVAGVLEFLGARTPEAWLAAAPAHLEELLIDHANCEKKAASTGLSLTYRYVDHPRLLRRMSRLVREELRHFEQVLDLIEAQGFAYRHLGPADYARGLHALIRRDEPGRLIDSLVCGAIVEARSCERFLGLVDVLPGEVATLYRQLLGSEARHFRDYLDLAYALGGSGEVDDRTRVFLDADRALIHAPSEAFRFHSGIPA